MKQSDEALIKAYKSGDESAIETLLERYKPYVQYKARTLYLIGGTSDDLIQEGMIGLFKAVHGYDDTQCAAFSRYAHVCITRKMYQAIEKSNRMKHQPLNSAVALEDGPEICSPEQMLIDREDVLDLDERIRQVLSKLENKVLEYLLQGLDYKEIAERLGKTPKQVDNAIQRIKNKLRNLMRQP